MGRSQWKDQQARCHGGSLLEMQHSREEGRSRRFLLCVEENCQIQTVTEAVKAGVPRDRFGN